MLCLIPLELGFILSYLVEEVPPVHRQPGAGHLNPRLNICKGCQLNYTGRLQTPLG